MLEPAAVSEQSEALLETIPTYRVVVSDTNPGTTTDTITVDVTVNPVNDPPAVSVSPSDDTFTENGNAVTDVFSGSSVDVIESGQQVQRLTVEVTNVADSSDEKLVVDGSEVALTDGTTATTNTNGLSVTVSVSGSTATVDITGGYGTSTTETVIDTLGYNHTGDDPTTTTEADKTHLQDNDAVRGFFFVTFLALRVYFQILKRLREKDLIGKISVQEVFYELSKIQLIVEEDGDEEYFAKVPKQAREIGAHFPECLPMG